MSQITRTKPSLTDESALPHGHGCSACGAPVDDADTFCVACGAEQAVTADVAEEADARHFFRCDTCGAEVATPEEQRSYVCPFCDSTYVVEYSPDATGRDPVEFVVGFAVTKEQALAKFHDWLRANAWYRPGDLHRAEIEEKLKGIYLPFWTFSMLATSSWSAKIGEYWYRTETYTTTVNGKTVTKTRQVRKTEWWPLSGDYHRYYSGYLISGSKGLPQTQSERIQPYHLAGLKRYRPFFLAGWQCEEYSIDRGEALAQCQSEFAARQRDNATRFLPGDRQDDLRINTNFERETFDLVLLPVYVLSYRYEDKLYRFLLNGQTGKVAGDKPVSKRRIGTAIGLAIAAAVLLFLLTQWLGR